MTAPRHLALLLSVLAFGSGGCGAERPREPVMACADPDERRPGEVDVVLEIVCGDGFTIQEARIQLAGTSLLARLDTFGTSTKAVHLARVSVPAGRPQTMTFSAVFTSGRHDSELRGTYRVPADSSLVRVVLGRVRDGYVEPAIYVEVEGRELVAQDPTQRGGAAF